MGMFHSKSRGQKDGFNDCFLKFADSNGLKLQNKTFSRVSFLKRESKNRRHKDIISLVKNFEQ